MIATRRLPCSNTHLPSGCAGWLEVQPGRMIHWVRFRWVMSSLETTGNRLGAFSSAVLGSPAVSSTITVILRPPRRRVLSQRHIEDIGVVDEVQQLHEHGE